MKDLLTILFIFYSIFSNAQIICIYCYDQNDSISQNVNNLVLNGGFELGCGNMGHFCPADTGYSCDITNWTCTGGGPGTYASTRHQTINFLVVEGLQVAYFGNLYCDACSFSFDDTSCLVNSSCTVIGIPVGFPLSTSINGGTLGISLEQTINGLIIGDTYVLEFWAGGEAGSNFTNMGLFAVDIGFGKTFLRNPPTPNGGIGRRYIIEFNATSSSHIIKFTNWGHINTFCTELVLDNVRLYTLSEISSIVLPCGNPSASFISPNSICSGTCVDFTNISSQSSSYHWSFPGGIPDTSTSINPSNICYLNPGSYSVTLIASNANGSDTLTLQNYITVFPQPPPQSITQIGDTLFAIAGSSSYQWYYNGNSISGATDYFYVATSSGDYNVVATDSNGCEVEAVINNVIAGLTPALSKGEGVTAFPNPVEDKFTIHDARLTSGTVEEISIYNTMGKKVMEVSPFSLGEGPVGEAVNCKLLPSGLYYLEIISGNKIYRTKFIKQ